MTFVSVILIVLICVGFALIIYAFFNKEDSNSVDLSDIEAVTELINRSVSEADGAIEQLNSLSESVFKEFDEKYQELLFLYQMIQEKKQTVIMSNNNLIENIPEPNTYADHSGTSMVIKKVVYDNPKLDEIQRLSDEGLSLAQISKKLNMGQGEVKLIMELGKTR